MSMKSEPVERKESSKPSEEKGLKKTEPGKEEKGNLPKDGQWRGEWI